MRLPRVYAGKGLLATSPARAAAEAFRNGRSLFLTGATGSGKTHTAVALLQTWFACNLCVSPDGAFYPGKGIPVFLPAPELFLEIKDSWREKENERGEREIVGRYANKPVLVIDDLGAEKISEWSRSVLYLLIDRRYRDCRQTIVTSNLSLDEIGALLDARIASRLLEMGEPIDFGNIDYRKTMRMRMEAR